MASLTYTLYHHPFSVCSLMVRYTLAIAGPTNQYTTSMDVVEKEIDIYNSGQLDEHFLTRVNPKGQVPVLAGSSLASPIADSLAITSYLADRHHALIPGAHDKQIRSLLSQLHALNYFSLSFGSTKPQMARIFIEAIDERLARRNISAEYRAALEYKRTVYVSSPRPTSESSTHNDFPCPAQPKPKSTAWSPMSSYTTTSSSSR